MEDLESDDELELFPSALDEPDAESEDDESPDDVESPPDFELPSWPFPPLRLSVT